MEPRAPGGAQLQELYGAPAVQARVAELGAAITRDYAGRSLRVLSVLKGSFIFAADLTRAIARPLSIDFLGLSSYGADTSSSGEVRLTLDLSYGVEGEDVLVVEDIVDTGLSVSFLLETLRARRPASVRVAALLHKPARQRRPVPIDYLGFTIPDVYVVGYGLDHAQRYRNLPYLAQLPEP